MAETPEPLPVLAMKQIDAVCDRFEIAWRAGTRPRIEDYLGSTAGRERQELLRSLLSLELELQAAAGESADESSYRVRFPLEAAIVQSVFEQMRETTPTAGPSADTSVSLDSVRSPVGSVPAAPSVMPKQI